MCPALLAAPLGAAAPPSVQEELTGSLVIEQIFGLPGIGKYFINGALQRDYTLVMGIVIVYAGMIMFFNMTSDVLYGALDPRARED